MVQVIPGFSLTNRWLLYASLMFTPAQYLSGLGSNMPTNIGFLAYNWYNQYVWYTAIKQKQLHALSLLPVHFNFIYSITYFGGITSGNIYMGILLGFGTAGLMILNTVAAWMSWATNMPEGYGVYQFFFFGWRTLNPNWHKFLMVWQISDTLFAAGCVFGTIVGAIVIGLQSGEIDGSEWWARRWAKYPAILLGSVVILMGEWPLILWTELIISRNHIESETDMIAVWLFVAQVVAMLLPDCCLDMLKKD